DIDESANGFNVPGGFRSNPFGYGIADVTAANQKKNGPTIQPGDLVRTLTIDHTRVDKDNAVGVLIDGATGDYSPSAPPSALVASGLANKAIPTHDHIA